MAFDSTNYYQLDYIQSGDSPSNTQYIDTGIIATNGVLKMTASFNGVYTGTQYQTYFGTRIGSGNIASFIFGRSSMLGYGLKGAWKAGLVAYSANTIYEIVSSLYYPNASLTVDGIEYGLTTNFTALNASAEHHYLFAYNNSGAVIPDYGMKLYDMKWYASPTDYANDNASYHFVPAMGKPGTPNDGVVGLYDVINQTFLQNAGSGTFTYGSIIPTGTPVYVKVGGVWKTGNLFIKQGGTWKSGTLFIKVSDTWHS